MHNSRHSAVARGEASYIVHRIEGFKTCSNFQREHLMPITFAVSFYVKSDNASGTMLCVIRCKITGRQHVKEYSMYNRLAKIFINFSC